MKKKFKKNLTIHSFLSRSTYVGDVTYASVERKLACAELTPLTLFESTIGCCPRKKKTLRKDGAKKQDYL